MKKRIISLILVVVMSVLALSGCAYSYDKDDMTKYATFNTAEFLKALSDKTIKVKNGDFGTDEAARKDKVNDEIFKNLASKADKEKKEVKGVLGNYDLLYYCYYFTAEIDGVTHTFVSMEEAKPANLQVGLSSLKTYQSEIVKLFAEKDIEEYVYSTSTTLKNDETTADIDESKLKAGDVVYVSYTKSFATVDKDGKESVEKVTVTNERLVLDATEGTFTSKLIGKSVGVAIDEIKLTDDTITASNKEVTYSSIKVNWIVNNEKEIGTFVDKTYTSTSEQKDIYGKSYDLKDKELTYHIFPVYFIDVAGEITVDAVLDYYYTNLDDTDSREEETTYLFACMDAGFKNGDDTLLELAKELNDKRSALTSAESAEKKAQEAVDKDGDAATDSQKLTLQTAKDATEAAKKEVDATEIKILACTNDKNEDVTAALVDGLLNYQYYTLETAYENAITESVVKEVFALAKKYITYNDTLPKKAVKAAYERIENGHKYDFYEGTVSGSQVEHDGHSHASGDSNFKAYHGDFNEYLLKKAYSGAKDIADVENKMMEEAKTSVKDIILVYSIKDALESNGASLDITKEQEEEFKQGIDYFLLEYQYGDNFSEDDYKTAMIFNNIFDYLLERKDNVDNAVTFERIVYDFTTADNTANK